MSAVKGVVNSMILGLGVALLLVTGSAAAEMKVAVVDYGKLMEESPQAKAVSEALKNEFTPRQRDLQAQQASVKSKEDRLQKDGATMTQEQRARADKELRDGARDFARKQSELQDDFNARKNEEMSRLQRTLIEEVRAYAKAQGFDIVFADGVIYSTPSFDITPAILTALQARPARPGAAPPAPASGSPTAPSKPTNH
jgi:outer membrane protein